MVLNWGQLCIRYKFNLLPFLKEDLYAPEGSVFNDHLRNICLSIQNNRTFDKKVSSTFQLCNHLFSMSNYVAFNETIPEDLWWPMNVDHGWIERSYFLVNKLWLVRNNWDAMKDVIERTLNSQLWKCKKSWKIAIIYFNCPNVWQCITCNLKHKSDYNIKVLFLSKGS